MRATFTEDGSLTNVYPLGDQLTRFLGIGRSHGDAISSILVGDPSHLDALLEAKGISASEVERLRLALMKVDDGDPADPSSLPQAVSPISKMAQELLLPPPSPW